MSFNLFREAKEHYDLLVPDKIEGLVLVSLYERFGNEEFSEDKINDTIDKIHKDLGRDSLRNEYERNNSIILKFQEFFLWRDEIKKTYGFKAYGKEFCEKIKERLENRYSPAEIKRLFDYLYNELLRHLETPELTFNLWFSEHFLKRTADITFQVEILDQQVSESVREFRKKIKEDTSDIFGLLRVIETNLNKIKDQALQLKDAFKATYDIEYKINDLMSEQDTQEFITSINSVMNFNSNIRGKLEQVSVRIDKIKPRIREFIFEFNQHDFDRKTSLFINLLLSGSQQIKNEKGKRTIILPEGVPELSIGNITDLPKFVIIPERDITPKIPVEVVTRSINTIRQEELAKIAHKKIYERQRVNSWFKYVIEVLANEKQLDFTKLFFQILIEEQSMLSIPIKVTTKIIREVSSKSDYKIIIIQQAEEHNLFPKVNIWKMQIQKM